MAAIDFPNSPTPGDTFTASNKTWVYLDGKWTLPSVDANGLVTTISSATSGQFLKWNGSAWVNDTIDLGADTAGSFVASLVAGTGVTLANNSGEAATPTVTVDTTVIAPLASPTFTGTVSGVTKSMVGLGSVDNTSDTGKPVSTAQQTALDLKANLASPTFTGTPTLPTGTIAVTQTVADNSTKVATTAFVRGEVTALVNSATATLDTLGEIATALGNDANLSATLTTSIGLKAPLASPTFTGTVTIPTGASITAPTGLVKGDVGLGNVDNTSNSTERAATATLTNKTLTSPVINTPTGIVKGDVGLGLVDNTADTAKPVSTAQQTALDLKANLASPTFTGTVTVPTPTNNTDATTKAYTDAIVTAAKIITAAGGDGTNGQALTTNGAGTLDFTTIVGTTEASIITAVGADGAAGSVLKTNGSGDLSFGDVALGTNTSGDYVASLVAGTGVTLTNNSGEGATPTVAIGQAVATNSNVTFNDLTVSGNLTVSGTTTSINTETVTVDDNIIILNNNATGAPTVDAGIEIERGSSTNVSLRWNETNDKWEFTNDGSTYTNLGAGGATISDTPPASPVAGQVWFESDTAKTFVYFDSQWIEIGALAAAGIVTMSDSAPASPADGKLWFNSSTAKTYVYYDSSWVEIGAGSNPAALNDVGDVTITSATSGQFLKWNGSAWVNDSIPTINTLDDVGDVTITSASSGQVLQWNGTAWVNAIGFSGNKQAILSSQIFG